VSKKDKVTIFSERLVLGEVAWVSGAALLMQRSTFNEIDGFDENFFLYKEEEDLCLRIRKKGHSVLYDPNVKILHFGSVVAFKDKYFAASLAYYREKNGDEDTV
jgi:GT2 family glycosyltransferase